MNMVCSGRGAEVMLQPSTASQVHTEFTMIIVCSIDGTRRRWEKWWAYKSNNQS